MGIQNCDARKFLTYDFLILCRKRFSKWFSCNLDLRCSFLQCWRFVISWFSHFANLKFAISHLKPWRLFAFWGGLSWFWLVGWLSGWLAGWLAGWLSGWLAGWLAVWLTCADIRWPETMAAFRILRWFVITSGKSGLIFGPWEYKIAMHGNS